MISVKRTLSHNEMLQNLIKKFIFAHEQNKKCDLKFHGIFEVWRIKCFKALEMKEAWTSE